MTLETKMKTTLKEKLKKGLKTAAMNLILASEMAALGGVIIATQTYLKPIRTETSQSYGTIVEVSLGEIASAKYLTSSGKIEEAIVRWNLEGEVSRRLLVEHQSIPAVIERRIIVYRSCWGKGAEKYSAETYVKSIE